MNERYAFYNSGFSCIPFFAGAFSNACRSMYSFKVCQTDFAGARMNAHSFRFLVVHSGMHAVVKQALRVHPLNLWAARFQILGVCPWNFKPI
jgi:hypothetical protein